MMSPKDDKIPRTHTFINVTIIKKESMPPRCIDFYFPVEEKSIKEKYTNNVNMNRLCNSSLYICIYVFFLINVCVCKQQAPPDI